VKDLFLYLREMVPSAVDAAAVSNRRLSEATSLKWTTVFVQPHDYAVLPKQMSGASLRLISKLVYFSPDIEYLGNREIVLDKHDRNSRRPRFNVLVGETKCLNSLDSEDFKFACPTSHSRGFSAKNFEACIIDFYRRQFNSSTSQNEFIAFLCGEAPSSMGSIVIHVLVTALDNDGFLHIIGAASSRICAGVCLSTLEYVCVSELSFVGKPVGPIGSASPEPNLEVRLMICHFAAVVLPRC